MQNSTDADARRPVVIYIIVAVVLFAALILGIRWAKSRSAYYAQRQTGQSQPVAQEGNQQTSPPATQPEPDQSLSQPVASSDSAASNTSSTAVEPTVVTPSRVPATGAEQVILPIISLSLVAFAGTSYVRARRRLQSLSV